MAGAQNVPGKGFLGGRPNPLYLELSQKLAEHRIKANEFSKEINNLNNVAAAVKQELALAKELETTLAQVEKLESSIAYCEKKS